MHPLRPRTGRRPALASAAAIAVLGLTACGGATDEPADEPAPSTSTSPPSEPATPPPTSGDPGAKPSGKAGEETTVRGTVAVGVEPGCRLLQTEGETLLLVGVAADRAPEGQRLVVTGVRSPGLMTTCQEGVPFEVRTLGPDDAG